MTLKAGTLRSSGIIVGRFSERSLRRQGLGVLQEVVDVLQRAHGLPVRLHPSSYTVGGPYPHGERSQLVLPRAGGAVARVLNAGGLLEVHGREVERLGYGDWAFVPPGQPFQMVSQLLWGVKLQIAVAQLIRG